MQQTQVPWIQRSAWKETKTARFFTTVFSVCGQSDNVELSAASGTGGTAGSFTESQKGRLTVVTSNGSPIRQHRHQEDQISRAVGTVTMDREHILMYPW
ncbi:hypothetical protein ACOMHN_006936 [Nucella lapillus]